MWDRQNNDRHVEQIALITDKGIFWLDDENNTVSKSVTGSPSEYGGQPGKQWFVKDGVVYYLKAAVHTHPTGDGWVDGPSDDDLEWAKSFGVPLYDISDGGIYKVGANGNSLGVLDYNYGSIFNCDLDQNIVEELR